MNDIPPGSVPEPLEFFDPEISRVCEILGRIAAQFPADSEESGALAAAASAFQAVHLNRQLKQRYDQLRGIATEQEMQELDARLRSYGIDPDAFDE